MTTSLHGPQWSLERRESSGTLVWRRECPRSKVRFRFDVEVLEFEKHPHEDRDKDDGFTMRKVSSTVVLCATCVAAVAEKYANPYGSSGLLFYLCVLIIVGYGNVYYPFALT